MGVGGGGGVDVTTRAGDWASLPSFNRVVGLGHALPEVGGLALSQSPRTSACPAGKRDGFCHGDRMSYTAQLWPGGGCGGQRMRRQDQEEPTTPDNPCFPTATLYCAALVPRFPSLQGRGFRVTFTPPEGLPARPQSTPSSPAHLGAPQTQPEPSRSPVTWSSQGSPDRDLSPLRPGHTPAHCPGRASDTCLSLQPPLEILPAPNPSPGDCMPPLTLLMRWTGNISSIHPLYPDPRALMYNCSQIIPGFPRLRSNKANLWFTQENQPFPLVRTTPRNGHLVT